MKRSEATPGGGVFRKKGVLRNFAKFTGKRLRHWCFFLRILWNFLETFSYGTLSLAASVLSLFSQITNNRFAIWLKGVPHMFTHLEFFQQFSKHFKLLFKIVFGYYEQNRSPENTLFCLSFYKKRIKVFWCIKHPFQKFLSANTAQRMKFSTKNFFSKCDQIYSKLRNWSHLLKKSVIGNFIFGVV